MIAERRRSEVKLDDMMERLISAQDEEGPSSRMTDQQVRDEVMTLLTAGHETIATGLTWTWYCLSQNPQVEAAVHEEVDRVLKGRMPQAGDLSELKYTEMVFGESMRLFPPVWGITRLAIIDHTLGGFRIPQGTILGLSHLSSIAMRYFSDPDRFDPFAGRLRRKRNVRNIHTSPLGADRGSASVNHLPGPRGSSSLIFQHWRLKISTDGPLQLQPLLTLRPDTACRPTLSLDKPLILTSIRFDH